MSSKTITIGGASGYWGDAAMGTPQLLASGRLDYLVYDYLAEITMSILARARAADGSLGYATDFVSGAMQPNLQEIAAQGIKVIANAGGVNPRACAEALRKIIADQGLDLVVAIVSGDDLIDQVRSLAETDIVEMFSGEAFPHPDLIASVNAYLGAFPIAKALDSGADIVVTGRCVDSAVSLAACIHAFGWKPTEYDKLAQGSLAGHVLECGTQTTGGNFTDWELIADSLADGGYPMAVVGENGEFEVQKPSGTGGLINVGTVGEQILYEIGDPRAYKVPDVVCDFSDVVLTQVGEDRVRVEGARGHGAPDSYKVSATWSDGYRGGHIWTIYGRDSVKKAQKFAEAVFARANQALASRGMEALSETCCEVIGAECHFGRAARGGQSREVDVKIAAKHPAAQGISVFLKEMSGLALAAPPGLTGFAGARARPSPVVRLYSFLLPKSEVNIAVEFESGTAPTPDSVLPAEARPGPHSFPAATACNDMIEVSLEQLAWGRSGDKGNKANIGIIARHPEFLPYIAQSLTEERVRDYFSHFINSTCSAPVDRHFMPGLNAINFLLHDVLGGGGVASLRSDPQGKGYAQLLLAELIPVPAQLAKLHQLSPCY